MITEITIENFKGIGERIAVQLRPITLLFGGNSAGKSSILHSLQYAREVLERHNLDPDRTVGTGNYVDLGGFARFVHDQDITKPIVLGLTVASRNRDVDFFFPLDALHDFLQFDRWSDGRFDSFGAFETASVEVAVRWSAQHNRPYVGSMVVTIDDVPLAGIESDPDGRRILLSLDDQHPSLTRLERWAASPDAEGEFDKIELIFDNPQQTCLGACLATLRQIVETDDEGRFFLAGQPDALITQNSGLQFVARDLDGTNLDELLHGVAPTGFIRDVIDGVSRLVVLPLTEVREHLASMRYLGPIRELPPRDFHPPRFADPSRWASGHGAWDLLHDGDESIIQAVSHWLGHVDRLNAGCRLERRGYREIDSLVLDLMERSAVDEVEQDPKVELSKFPIQNRVVILPDESQVALQPHDVGIGISQLVPVIVTALDESAKLAIIEQPELHIHPRLQSELGDLFIEAATEGRTFLLETHSEHVMLRLLRRIRETSENEVPPGRPSLLPSLVCVNYVELDVGRVRITPLRIDESGEFRDRWPKGFFEERASELF